MEFKEYLQIFKKQKNTVINSVIALVILTAAFTLVKPVTYDNDLTILVARSGTQATSDYKYDGYYAAQASDTFADNVSQWLASASLVSEIYSRAKIAADFGNLKAFSKAFKAEKLSSQYVEVRYQTKDRESAVKLARSIADVLQEKADSLSKAGNDEMSFKIIYNDPFTLKSGNNMLTGIALAVFAGLFLGILMAFGKEYFN